MKFCEKCGKQLLDEAVICIGCGCQIKGESNNKGQKVSTFIANRKKWLIVLSVLFVVFALALILILASSGFDTAIDLYQFYHTEVGMLGKNLSSEGAIKWQENVANVKSTLTTYYIGIGVCGILALASLVGDVLLFTAKSKNT